MDQLELIAGLYRCHNCGRDTSHTTRVQRWRLCDECYTAIMPDWEQTVLKPGRPPAWYADTEEQRDRIGQFWDWNGDMEDRYPVPKRSRSKQYLSWLHDQSQASVDDYWPLCECGGQRATLQFAAAQPGLWGGPFMSRCPRCDARADVDAMIRLHQSIHPDWDDEDWLDALYRINPRAFELGVLPDYWFERRQGR